MDYNRRKFISFMGKASVGSVIMPQFLISCGNTTTPTKDINNISTKRLNELKAFVLKGLMSSDKDDLLLANGLNYHTVVKWGDKISETDTFGFNNDFTCFIPFDEPGFTQPYSSVLLTYLVLESDIVPTLSPLYTSPVPITNVPSLFPESFNQFNSQCFPFAFGKYFPM